MNAVGQAALELIGAERVTVLAVWPSAVSAVVEDGGRRACGFSKRRGWFCDCGVVGGGCVHVRAVQLVAWPVQLPRADGVSGG